MNSDLEKNETAKREEEILAFWKKEEIFKKSLDKKSPKGEFVFYDGPPFATGLPHYGSLLSSIVKDVIPRYKTMRGYHVRRRWGWDCHGLPIENMVEKELGIKDKKGIEEFGIEKFNETCRASVLKFADEWEKYVDRVGRFVEYENAYKTMDLSYMESVWWALKNIYDKGLLYEGRKVLLYCPHCETPLAKSEVAMDNSYKDITEEAVTVKFEVKNSAKHGLPENTYLLAWTTTPWTLPGNIALAVGRDIQYVLADSNGQNVILAKELLKEGMTVLKEVSSEMLVGLEYEPLYKLDAVENTNKKAWYVTDADFVTTEEGTGIVHTAVMYGEDDYALGLEKDLPQVPLLDVSGHFNTNAPGFIQGKYFKKAEKELKHDLEKRGLLFDRADNTHSYPHCHRCDTPLLYNAISSWFINIQKVKKRLIRLNKKVTWFPEHIKFGRFLGILKSAPDWTISRNRYWASALPIWKCGACKEIKVIGSIEELSEHVVRSGNNYFVVRHGHAESNERGLISSRSDDVHHLTDQGKEEAKQAVEKLQDKNIDIIFSSIFIRTRETAEIIAHGLGIDKKNIVFDSRIQEISMGEWNGKKWDDYYKTLSSMEDRFIKPPDAGESYDDVKRRIGGFLYELEEKYKGKNILIVSHGSPIATMHMVSEGANKERGVHISHQLEMHTDHRVNTGDIRKLPFTPLPHNRNFEIDIHRPYIDSIELTCVCGETMRRIPEVVDGWVESASMPFAEHHYPFENKKIFKSNFPGDFISEYIAQTRTWFYNMHVMGGILFKKPTFKNVITTGTILASDGSKMSKSKGNYTDPLKNLNVYGADALRYYLMTSVVMQAEDLRFTDDDVKEVHNRLINILWNVQKFYSTYADENDDSVKFSDSKNVLDQWIIAKLGELTKIVTENLDNLNTVKAGRPIRDFVTDFSTWFIRRSRSRFKSDDTTDRRWAIATTKHVLKELSKIIAPLMPFIAESIYRDIGGEKESVHLEDWPGVSRYNKSLIADMEDVRALVSAGLEARAEAGVKIRQPLASLRVRDTKTFLQNNEQMVQLIKDELNVKDIIVGAPIDTEVSLDTTLTKELIEEGRVRELVRSVQALRKGSGLNPSDTPTLLVDTNSDGKQFLESNMDEIQKLASLGGVTLSDLGMNTDSIDVNGIDFKISF
jgi:isoleucyl-tRNA synthetase